MLRGCIYFILFCCPCLTVSQTNTPAIDYSKILINAIIEPDSSLFELSKIEKFHLDESNNFSGNNDTYYKSKAFCYYIKGDTVQTDNLLQFAFEKSSLVESLQFEGLVERTFIKPPEVSLIIKKFIGHLYQSALESKNEIQLLSAYVLLENILELEENVPEAMKLNFNLLEMKEVRDNEFAMIKSRVHSNLGRLSRMLGEFDKAVQYHQTAIDFSPDTSDYHIELDINHKANIGNAYRESGRYLESYETDSAMLIKRYQIRDTNGIVYQHTSLAISLVFMDELEKAQEEIIKAEHFLNPRTRAYQKHKSRLAYAKGEYSIKKKNFKEAVDQCYLGYRTALDSMRDQRLMRAVENCNCIYRAYEALNNHIEAYQWYKKTILLKDSLLTKRNRQSLLVAEISMKHKQRLLLDSLDQVEKERIIRMRHQDEVRQKNQQRNILLGSGLLLLLLSGGLYSRWRYVRKSRDIISRERDRSENLLLNILPVEIAEELKEKGEAEARDFEMVSILFTDFKKFTEVSEKLSAADLVDEINNCFRAFDGICGNYKIEKIKTIGDAYMAAGGLPVPMDDSVEKTILAALEMQEFIADRKKQRDGDGLPAFEMRVGIHTGPVVAGIVGVKKFQYDIWGDTVNTASRIENNGVVGKVNISHSTYELIKDDPQFSFESRGKISAKGKGEMEMYFVSLKSNAK